jgi:hypothetical protein
MIKHALESITFERKLLVHNESFTRGVVE